MDLLIDEIGPFGGSQAVQILEDGKYLSNVDVNGPWTVRVQQ